MKTNSLILFVLVILFNSCSKKDDSLTENIIVTITSESSVMYNNVEIKFFASVSHQIKEAKFYLNGQLIGTSLYEPYNVSFTPKDIDAGLHEVKCVVVSNSGNEFDGSKNVEIQLRLGDEFKGGKIFYLDETGKHGLIAATTDMVVGDLISFSWGTTVLIGTDRDNGKENTRKMADNSTVSSHAGYHFKNNYNHNNFNDWYIPAINELIILKENKNYVGGFSNASNWEANYWSSTELSATNAEALHFNVLMGNSYEKNLYHLKVRPIRKF